MALTAFLGEFLLGKVGEIVDKFIRPLGFAFLLFVLSSGIASTALAQATPGSLLAVRHAWHPGKAYSRVVFDLRGEGRLKVDSYDPDNNVVYLTLHGVSATAGRARCRTAGKASIILSSISDGAVCLMKAGLVESMVLRRGIGDRLEIDLRVRNAQAGELVFKTLELRRGSRREVIDLRVEKGAKEVAWKWIP